MVSRREMLGATAIGGVALLHAATARASQADGKGGWQASYSGSEPDAALPPGEPGTDYTPVITPNGKTLKHKVIDGWKIFHLRAGEVEHEFAPGLKAKCWGYNGRVHGPTIEAVEGDRVRIYVTNELKAPTTVHWHGVFLPSGMDGVAGLSQRAIQPGETFKYEFPLRQHGTLMYHSHHDEMTQMALGMMGMIVIHPRKPAASYRVDRDFVIMLSEWLIKPGTARPDPNAMSDFNVLTMNAKVFPGTRPLVCKKGDRVRIRFGNLGAMDHHPVHLHGHFFKVVATDGGALPVTAQWPESTVLVPVGSTRDIEFIADALGDWPLHCHMTHHMMNQMSHGMPNPVGIKQPKKLDERVQKVVPDYMTMGENGMGEHPKHVEAGLPVPKNSIPMKGLAGPHDYITMGGMFTILKVREDLKSYSKDPGWYENPPGTQSVPATPEELARDGIKV
jgi:manganese oxidase